MATNIVIPEVGESVSSGVIAAWSKPEGAWIERDETVLELETDKITMEVPAPASGVVSHAAAEGDEVDVGAVVGTIDESAAKPADAGGSGEAKAEQAESSSTPAAPAPAAATATAPPPAPPAATSNGSANAPSAPEDDSVPATPLARKLAAQYSVRLGAVKGTGAGGRIREQDVLAAMQSPPAAPSSNGSAAPAPAAAPAGSRGSKLERMSPMRQRIASRLVEAQQTAAMLTTFNEVDMTNVMALRKKHKDAFGEKHGIGLGFMSFFVKAACGALQQFPDVNAYITADEKGSPAVQRHDYCDVAIAVSSPKGLVVPVLRSAETMTFAGIESSIKEYAIKAKDGKLDLADMQGGTFTITNGGIFGSLMSTPILNPPQSAILGMHGIKKRAVEHPDKPGEIALRPMMYLALSYDHRIVDGAGAVRFLVSIKDAIEDPARLMLDL